MRTRRNLGVAVLLLLAIIFAFYWHLKHSFNFAIRLKGQQACQGRQPCIFTLGKIFTGTWDRVLVFDMAASQEEIDTTVGKHIPKPDLERLVVFMQGSNVVRTIAESQGIERPGSNDVLIEGAPLTQNHVVINRDAAFILTAGPDSCNGCKVIGMLKPGEVVE